MIWERGVLELFYIKSSELERKQIWQRLLWKRLTFNTRTTAADVSPSVNPTRYIIFYWDIVFSTPQI